MGLKGSKKLLNYIRNIEEEEEWKKVQLALSSHHKDICYVECHSGRHRKLVYICRDETSGLSILFKVISSPEGHRCNMVHRVDRIVDVREVQSEKPPSGEEDGNQNDMLITEEYLVKWQGLPYDCCTWE